MVADCLSADGPCDLALAALPLLSCPQLTVVGRIVNVMDRGSNLVANITDGTGDLEVTYWLQEDSEHVSATRLEACRAMPCYKRVKRTCNCASSTPGGIPEPCT